MPLYAYKCLSCSHTHEEERPITGNNSSASCPICTSDSKRIPSSIGLTIRGGLDGWVGKGAVVGKQMTDKNDRVRRKRELIEKENPMIRLVPNVEGERVDSWGEAAKLAASKGYSPEGYLDLAASEAKS